jgi:hypothetical protein
VQLFKNNGEDCDKDLAKPSAWMQSHCQVDANGCKTPVRPVA